MIPKRHIDDIHLSDDELIEIQTLKKIMLRYVGMNVNAFHFDYNFGCNNGADAGQTIFHCHYHLIFRNRGDVPNPRGGIRNVIPSQGNPEGYSGEAEVLNLTKKFRLMNHLY